VVKLFNKNTDDYPDDAEYIGRGSPYGNPFKIGADGTREEVIRRFECEVLPTLDVSALRGKDLVCFCHPKPCHGTPIMRKANAAVVKDCTGNFLEADFRAECYWHQAKEFIEHGGELARALAWTMRTAKSKHTIDKACLLAKLHNLDGVLIFAPNGVHLNWIEREIPAHLWKSVPANKLAWKTATVSKAGIEEFSDRPSAFEKELVREEWLLKFKTFNADPKLLFFACNSESVSRKDMRRAIITFLKKRKRVLLVVDESDDYAVPNAKRTKWMRSIAKKCFAKLILSGTMLTGGLLGAFSQFEILQEGALGFTTYEDFKNHFAIFTQERGHNGRTFPKFLQYKNEEELRARIAKFTSVVLREECDDMPDIVEDTRLIIPTPQMLKAYDDLMESFRTLIGDDEVSIGERTQRFVKLQQVMSGFVKDEFGVVHRLQGANPRIEAVRDEVLKSPGKVIVWCHFHEDMDMVKRALLLDGHTPVEYHGRVSSEAKQKALQSFRTDRAIKPLIGHTNSGGRGLDFSVASTIIYYSHTFSARMRAQSIERATKVGGKNIRVLDFIAPGPDKVIRRAVKSRIDVNDYVAGSGLRKLLSELEIR
jgi:hypothetical protein